MDTSPVGMSATISAIVAAIIAVLVAFGVPLTDDQRVAILGLIGVLAPVLVWVMQRGRTTPLADPKDETGVELVRKVDNMPPLQAQRYRIKQAQ